MKIEIMKAALELIAQQSYGLQKINEEYGHDTNAYNYHAMEYFSQGYFYYQYIARNALDRIKQMEELDEN